MSMIEVPVPPIVVMGISGCGKSTVATILASILNRPFVEGDDLHPPANIQKMSAGVGLNDDDRFGWLATIGERLRATGDAPPVVSCSALKRRYRQQLRDGAQQPIVFIHLEVPRADVVARLSRRENHFMPIGLVDSQFADLEDPAGEDDVVTVTGPGAASELAHRFLYHLYVRRHGSKIAVVNPTPQVTDEFYTNAGEDRSRSDRD